jgi:osmotically-inducible protein OsmY
MATRHEHERYSRQPGSRQRDRRYGQNYPGQDAEPGNYGYRDWDWNEEGRSGQQGMTGQGRREHGGWQREDYYDEGSRGGYRQPYGGGRENDWPQRGRFGNEYDSDSGGGNGNDNGNRDYAGGYRSGYGERGSSRYGSYGGYAGYGGYGSDTGNFSGSEYSGYSGAMSGNYGERNYGGQSQSRFRGVGPKGYTRSDERLKENISDRLMDDPDIDPSEIEIEVSDGEVTLSGNVESRNIKFEVERLIDAISGVKDVHNQLRVQRQGRQESGAQDDEESGSQGRRSGQSAGSQPAAGKSSRTTGGL